MKKITDIFLRALLTGVAIAIGGTVYLSCPNKYLGAFLFGTGLFVILTFGFNLFTGKVGYAVENKPSYLGELVIGYGGILWGHFIAVKGKYHAFAYENGLLGGVIHKRTDSYNGHTDYL